MDPRLASTLALFGLLSFAGCGGTHASGGTDGGMASSTYNFCVSSSGCGVGESCFEVSTDVTGGAFCSQTCTADAQCERNLGFDGACMVAGLDGTCFQECDVDSDCFSSSGCWDYTDTDGFENRVCLPERL